jgi:folate-dependent phosphoribosylglycinamide formyltransferase PurN
MWIAFFSQTGAEIADIAESLGRWPDRIITNDRPEHLRTIDSRIQKQGYFTFNNKPDIEEYMELFERFPGAIVTLHGWLRVIPDYVCQRTKIFNGHPGLITKYPELKGKDPQVRAWEGKYNTIGAVLHKVTAGVDEGPIESWSEKSVNKLSLDETFLILRDMSLRMWTNFLKKVL